VVAADGAVVDDDVPGPERHGVPLVCASIICSFPSNRAFIAVPYLLHLEPLLAVHVAAWTGLAAFHLGRRARVGHLHVRHAER